MNEIFKVESDKVVYTERLLSSQRRLASGVPAKKDTKFFPRRVRFGNVIILVGTKFSRFLQTEFLVICSNKWFKFGVIEELLGLAKRGNTNSGTSLLVALSRVVQRWACHAVLEGG